MESIAIFQNVKYEMSVLLKPLDVVVAVKAAVLAAPRWTIAEMAEHLGMDSGQVFRAARHASKAALLFTEPERGRLQYRPHRAALTELLVHGAKYMFVPSHGRLTRGMPTAHAAPILRSRIAVGDEPPPVWPTADGDTRGESFEPLHRCVPVAAARDRRFYDAMALVDAIRGGRARERELAVRLLPEVLGGDHE